MPPEDVITRGDLDRHCDRHHKPIEENFRDVKGWLSKLDGRLWAVVIGMFMVFVTAALNMLVALQTRQAVQPERNRTYYHQRLDRRLADAEAEAGRDVRVP
jgi:hypothetical protein